MSPAASIGVIDAEAQESTLFQQKSALIYTCSGLIYFFLQSLGEERLVMCVKNTVSSRGSQYLLGILESGVERCGRRCGEGGVVAD